MDTFKSSCMIFLKDKESFLLKEASYFPLENSSIIYCIEEGIVDLYAFASSDNHEEQTSQYIDSFEEGEALFGFNREIGFKSFFIRAHSHVSLKKCSFDEWNEFSKDQIKKEVFQEVLENWILKLGASLQKKDTKCLAIKVNPLQKLHLGKDQTIFLTFEAETKKVNQVVWIFLERGNLIINDEAEISLSVDIGYFPLLDTDKITASEESEFSIKTTDQMIVEGISAPCLNVFYENFLRRVQKQKEDFIKESKLQVLADIAFEKRLIQNSCYILSKVLSHTQEIPVTYSDDDLIKACQYVALKLGALVNCERFSKNLVTAEDKVREIAQRSSLSYRQVKLTPELFDNDFDPIIVFDDKTKETMVLSSSGKKVYKAFNVKTNIERNFSKKYLGELAPKGYVLYKNLPKVSKGFKLFKFVFEKQWIDISVVLAVSIASAVISLYSPLAMSWIFDQAVPSHNKAFLLQIVAGLVMVGVGSSLFSLTRAFALLRLEGKTANKLQAALWNRLLSLRLPFFKRYTVGDLYQRVSAVDEIRSILGGHTLNTIISSIFSLIYLIVMLYKSVFLSLVMLIPITMTLVIYIVVIAMTIKRELIILNLQATIYGFFVQIIGSIKNIRVFNAENRAFAKWSVLFANKKKKEIELMAIHNWLMVSHSIITNSGQMIMYFIVIGFLIEATKGQVGSNGHILKIGDFLSFSAAYGMFSAAVFSIGSSFLGILKDIIPRWQRAKDVLEEEPEKRNLEAHFEKIYGEISLDKVFFRYTEKTPMLLKNITFRVKKGSFIGIIGGSGSGKSTLVKLLLGFEKPIRGAISFDDRLIETFDITYLRQQMGIVLQNGSILSGSIRENINCSRIYTDEEIMQVLNVCCLEEDIENLPMKLETIVPPGGGTMSHGQRVRLLLARALIQKPNILIIDDVLSSLDDDLQEIIKKNIEELNMTRIVISQKISTIKNADYIYVIDDGEIIESGSYKALMSKEGLFSKIVKRQTL